MRVYVPDEPPLARRAEPRWLRWTLRGVIACGIAAVVYLVAAFALTQEYGPPGPTPPDTTHMPTVMGPDGNAVPAYQFSE